jgi:hypothetical protein
MKKPKTKSFTTISISHDNHNQLQKLGNLGDTFDEVLTKVLKKLGSDQDSVAGDHKRFRFYDRYIRCPIYNENNANIILFYQNATYAFAVTKYFIYTNIHNIQARFFFS